MKQFKNQIDENGLSSFLTDEVDVLLGRFIYSYFKSKTTEKVLYGLKIGANLYGQTTTTYETYLTKSKLLIDIYFVFQVLFEFFKKILTLNFFFGFANFTGSTYLDSAPIESKDFEIGLHEAIGSIKTKIKEITLGTI